MLKKDTTLGTALIDMYVKCSALSKAQELFDNLTIPDTIAWNALIAGYAQLGQPRRVFNVFGKMRESNTIPDLITFLVLLNACSHAGLVQEGGTIFATMESVYKFIPTLEQYTCMVDLFSRAGHFDKAMVLIEEVLPFNRFQLLLALLAACRQWINLDLGRWIFQHLEQLDGDNAAAYVCISNIYAGVHMQDEVNDDEEVK